MIAEKDMRNWTDWDPARFLRDVEEIAVYAPGLQYVAPSSKSPSGGWVGDLPIWPFSRPEPSRLAQLITRPLRIGFLYSDAHPMIAPQIYPLDPIPDISEESDTAWHVAPGGSLCLLRSEGDWMPNASVTELLMKASGWHIEYALMRAGLVSEMTESGIASDESRDILISMATDAEGGENEPQ